MQSISIGRDSTNQIVLNDKFVSRQHAQLHISNQGQVIIKDLSSSNGTFVNGNRVMEYILNPGDVVKCGSAFLNWENYIVNPVFNTVPSIRRSASNIDNSVNSNQSDTRQTAISNKDDLQSSQRFNESPKMEQDQYSQKHSPVQQNVVIVGKAKSVGTAFILAFFFGPLGLFYVSILGGVVMFFASIVLFIVIPIIGYFVAWIGCMIWAVVAANEANDALQKQARSIINNKF